MSLGDIAAKPGVWFHRAVILRLLTLIHTASGRALRNRLDMDWKTRALADFSDWLDDLARQVSRMGALEDKLREETTADILQAFLDIRDSLAREKLPLALKRSQEAESLCRYAGLLSGRRRKIRPAPAGSSGQQRKQDNRDESIWYMRYSFMIFITLSSKQERRKVFIGC
jgi:hypothetical protein